MCWKSSLGVFPYNIAFKPSGQFLESPVYNRPQEPGMLLLFTFRKNILMLL